jgi:hypothetical protein
VPAGRLDLAQHGHARLVPLVPVGQEGRQHHDDEAVRDIRHAGVPRLQAAFDLAADHDDREARGGHGKRQRVDLVQVPANEGELVDAAGVVDVGVVGQPLQAELGNQLVDGDDHADRADEAAEEGA